LLNVGPSDIGKLGYNIYTSMCTAVFRQIVHTQTTRLR